MQSSPLAALKDVIPPSEVSWWPLSVLAWATLIGILIFIILVTFWLYRRHQFGLAKREAIELAKESQNDALILHSLLKRLMKHYYGAEFTTLPSPQWTDALEHLTKQRFTLDEINSLYSSTPDAELNQKLMAAIKRFKLRDSLVKEVYGV
ncbi:putative orphan protein [Pseudoalteromonas luteoviolacea B = ATCC 29581]|nr:putative orphan protein [Pseudoalteromonas luteoviolacea B = ATCC 29581]